MWRILRVSVVQYIQLPSELHRRNLDWLELVLSDLWDRFADSNEDSDTAAERRIVLWLVLAVADMQYLQLPCKLCRGVLGLLGHLLSNLWRR